MSAVSFSERPRGRTQYRVQRLLVETGSVLLAVVLLIWTLVPIYNMFLVELDPSGHNEFTDEIYPSQPTLAAFTNLWTAEVEDVRDIWPEFANSVWIGLVVMTLTALVGSLASFAIGRMRLGRDWTITTSALLIYVIPSSVLIIPFLRVIHIYGLMDNPWAVIAAEVTFATPYAILILHYYAKLIPLELDDAARIDGASVVQVYLRIYLPLMAPALVAVGTYALLLAWNEYLYQFMLLSSKRNMTVAVALAQFLNSDEAPWNYMMATAIIYAIPPVAIYYVFRRRMTAGLTMGGVKG